MDRVVRAYEKVSSDSCEFVSGSEHEFTDADPVITIQTRNVIGKRRSMHSNFGMRMRTQQFGTFRTDSAVTKCRTRCRTANDSDVLSQCCQIPLLGELDSIAISDGLRTGEFRLSRVGRKVGVLIGFENRDSGSPP